MPVAMQTSSVHEEIPVLTQQLTSQMEYNNLLLEHLQKLEETQIAAQRELKRRDQALRLAVAVSDSAQKELESLRQTCHTYEDTMREVGQQWEETKSRAEKKDQDLELHMRQVLEARQMCEQLQEQKSAVESRLMQTEQALSVSKLEMDRQKATDKVTIEKLTLTVETLTGDVNSIKQRHLPLAEEHKRLSQSTTQLERQLEDVNSRLHRECRERAAAEERMKTLEASSVNLKDVLKELRFTLNEERAKSSLLEADVAAALEGKRRAENDLDTQEAWLSVLRKEHKEMVKENKALKHELEHMATELLQQARQRGEEQEKWADKMNKTQQELQRVSEEARMQAQRHELEAERRSSEYLSTQTETEERYMSLQREQAELHVMLKTLQQETQQAAERFQTEREQLQAEAQKVRHKLAETEQLWQGRERELIEQAKRLATEIKASRAESDRRGSRYLEVLSTVQEVVRKLATEGQGCKDQIMDLAKDFETLQKCVQTFTANQSGPIEAWFREVTQGMQTLVHQYRGLQKETDGLGGQVQEKDNKLEALKVEVSNKENELHSLRHELAGIQDRLSKDKRSHLSQLANLKEELQRAQKEKSEAERRHARLQESYDKSSSRNVKLQAECQSLTSKFAELRAGQTVQTERSDNDYLSLEQKCRNLETMRLDLLHEQESRLRAMEEEEKEKIRLRDRMGELESIIDRQQEQLQQVEASAQRKIQELNSVLRQSVRQMENTQKLMDLMRQTKDQTINPPQAPLSRPTGA